MASHRRQTDPAPQPKCLCRRAGSRQPPFVWFGLSCSYSACLPGKEETNWQAGSRELVMLVSQFIHLGFLLCRLQLQGGQQLLPDTLRKQSDLDAEKKSSGVWTGLLRYYWDKILLSELHSYDTLMDHIINACVTSNAHVEKPWFELSHMLPNTYQMSFSSQITDI